MTTRTSLSSTFDKIESACGLEAFIQIVLDSARSGDLLTAMVRKLPVKLTTYKMQAFLDAYIPDLAHAYSLQSGERRQAVQKYFAQRSVDAYFEKVKRTQITTSINNERKAVYHLYDPKHSLLKYCTADWFNRFRIQRHRAFERNVDWHFDFLTWLKWWSDTGHIDDRGRQAGEYQMCRYGDVGPYSSDNCYCVTGEQNRTDYWNDHTSNKYLNDDSEQHYTGVD